MFIRQNRATFGTKLKAAVIKKVEAKEMQDKRREDYINVGNLSLILCDRNKKTQSAIVKETPIETSRFWDKFMNKQE